jgi:RNA polymerase sigma factor (sigma-70 family)
MTDDGFAEFCRAVAPVLRRALVAQVRDADLAEDLTHDALVRVAERWERVRAMERPDLYALRVGVNLATSWWRRVAARDRALTRADAGADRAWHDPDGASSVAVRAAVAELPARQREAVALRFGADLAVADVATVMGCSEGTVKTLTHRALARLRVRLGEDDERPDVPGTSEQAPADAVALGDQRGGGHRGR